MLWPNPLGSTFNARIGKNITIKSINLHLMVLTDNNQVVPRTMRILLCLDKQPNGGQANANDVLSDVATVEKALVTHSEAQRRHRFDILFDTNIHMPGMNTVMGNGPAPVQSLKYYKKTNIFVQYEADTMPAVIGDVSTGNLFLMVFHNEPLINFPLLLFESRLRFLD